MLKDVQQWCLHLDQLMLAAGFTSSVMGEADGAILNGYHRAALCEGAPVVYLSAGMHGDEPAGPLAVAKLLELEELSHEVEWLICPLLNPTGMVAGSREASSGMDLNRDYYFLKSREVQAHVAWLKNKPSPDLMLSLHEDWESTGFYFYEINTRMDQPERAHALLERVEQVMQREPELKIDDHVVREPGWIYHEAMADEFQNWPEAIYMAKNGCPVSLTMETPSSLEIAQRVNTHMVFVLAAIGVWLKEN